VIVLQVVRTVQGSDGGVGALREKKEEEGGREEKEEEKERLVSHISNFGFL